MGVVESMFQSFAAGRTTDKSIDAGPPANAWTTKSNPVFKSVEDLNGSFRINRVDGFEYIAFGDQDDMPSVLDKLSLQSPTHKGIINKKAKMIVGKGVNLDSLTYNSNNKSTVAALFKNIGGRDIDFNKVFTKAAYSYELYGAIPYVVKLDNNGKMIGLRVAEVRSVRAAVPNDKLQITHWIERRTFRFAHSRLNEKAKKIPVYKANSKSGEFMVYVMNPASGNPFYGLPSYIAAYYYITGDFEFGKHIDNAVKNGFSPSVAMSFIGRQMTEEQKQSVWDRVGQMFTGSDGLKYMINFVRNKEEMPKLDVIEAKNLDKTIATMSELNDAKILTAHSVTSPTLFGIMVSGKLGGTGEELLTAYYTFRATETIPNRDVILAPIRMIFERQYGVSDMNPEDEPIEAILPNSRPVIGEAQASQENKKEEGNVDN